jgi:glycosyltransferase involved in cell wall biosynthesis
MKRLGELLIITDAKVQKKEGIFYLHNAVYKEIIFFQPVFDSIKIIATDFTHLEDDKSLKALDESINVITLKPIGRNNGYTPLFSFFYLLKKVCVILKLINKANYVHVRGPNLISLFSILCYFITTRKKWWFKFATNWGGNSSSLNFRFQKFLLQHVKISTTLNGRWPDQPKHCISLMNPCLTDQQFEDGQVLIQNKIKGDKATLIFVGRLDTSKGIDLLIDSLPSIDVQAIEKFHVVGEGPLKEELQNKLIFSEINFEMHGLLSQEEIFVLMAKSHFLILTSKSEGFPKVVAEGLNYGCLPIVTAVGSIPHYIDHNVNGFIIPELTPKCLARIINGALGITSNNFERLIINGKAISEECTYERYIKNIQKYIICQ